MISELVLIDLEIRTEEFLERVVEEEGFLIGKCRT